MTRSPFPLSVVFSVLFLGLSCASPQVTRSDDLSGGLSQIEKLEIRDFQFCATKHIERILVEGVLDDQDFQRDSRQRVPIFFTPENVSIGGVNRPRDVNKHDLTSFITQELDRTGKAIVVDRIDAAGAEVRVRLRDEVIEGENKMFRGREVQNTIIMEFQLWSMDGVRVYSWAQPVVKFKQ